MGEDAIESRILTTAVPIATDSAVPEASVEPSTSAIDSQNATKFNYFFGSLIAACCFVIILPKMSRNPGTLLFCYFFIALSVFLLFLNWYKIGKNEIYVNISVFFIIVSIFFSFIMISTNKTKIQNGTVTDYYYKFNLISIWLIAIECYLLFQLHNLNRDLKGYMFIILCFCTLNIFIVISNWIGLAHFSADG